MLAAEAETAGLIKVALASQGRTRGPGVGDTEVIQVREDDGASAGAITGIMGMFWMPERDSCSPLSNVADLELEGQDAQGWVMGSDLPSNTSTASWGAMAGGWVLECGNPPKSADCGVSTPAPTWLPLSNIGELRPSESNDEG